MFEKIIDSYNLASDSYPDKNRSEEHALEIEPLYTDLFTKWGHKIPKGWYGFDMPLYLPKIWFLVIDNILDEVNEGWNEFEIHQIKLKFGGMRLYLGAITPDIQKELNRMEDVLYDKKFIY